MRGQAASCLQTHLTAGKRFKFLFFPLTLVPLLKVEVVLELDERVILVGERQHGGPVVRYVDQQTKRVSNSVSDAEGNEHTNLEIDTFAAPILRVALFRATAPGAYIKENAYFII